MKYFLDTEFLEGTQKSIIPFIPNKPTIDLISIGIVSEDNREYYAVSKDFNIKEAWDRWQWEYIHYQPTSPPKGKRKQYWIRENVLYTIFVDLLDQDTPYIDSNRTLKELDNYARNRFTYKKFKYLINKYGKSNEEIAEDIKDFISQKQLLNTPADDFATHEIKATYEGRIKTVKNCFGSPEFYTYYGAYDWVVFCWLFGKMIDLPRGFPMFSKDLKVMLDDKAMELPNTYLMNMQTMKNVPIDNTLKGKLDFIKNMKNYPKQSNVHNALADARWNKQLYEFINTL